MSGFVYAGVAQLVSLELWRPEWSWGAIAGIAVVTATVNARMVLQGASLQPWFAKYPKALNAFHLFFFTDANWLIGTRYRAEGGRDLGVLVGAGLALWLVWVRCARSETRISPRKSTERIFRRVGSAKPLKVSAMRAASRSERAAREVGAIVYAPAICLYEHICIL